jgi:hypothetical protein
LPLATPETDPKAVLRKGKASEEETSITEPVSRFLNFGSVPVEFSPLGLGSEGQDFVTPLSPEAAPWCRPVTSEDFPSPVQGGAPADWSSIACSPNHLLFPTPLRDLSSITPSRTTSPPSSPTPNIPMVSANPPLNRMDAIVAARYAPLVLPHPMNPLPAGDYLKYMPKFTGEGDLTSEEHLATFYSYADNLNIENEDVWMRVFIQSLDGEVRKWFRGLAPGSIAGIEALDSAFLRQ